MIRVGRGRSREVIPSMPAVRPNVDIAKSLDHPPNEILEAIPAGQP
jgi:hypothetical protein